jgi:chromosomal replication initiation ATPase DnaA
VSEQLRLSFRHAPASGAADFMPAPCNRDALAWLARWPDWPAPALLLHGPPGCGKSHLARIWAARTGARWLERRALASDGEPGLGSDKQPACVLDDALPVEGEQALLAIYNELQARRGHLLLTARAPVAAWGLRLPDLASRLRAAPAVAIGPPDDALLGAVLLKLFADRQVLVSEAVIEYLVRRMERSFDAARQLVVALDAASLSEQRPITVALARTLLEQYATTRT